jgi:hypothetical protein
MYSTSISYMQKITQGRKYQNKMWQMPLLLALLRKEICQEVITTIGRGSRYTLLVWYIAPRSIFSTS